MIPLYLKNALRDTYSYNRSLIEELWVSFKYRKTLVHETDYHMFFEDGSFCIKFSSMVYDEDWLENVELDRFNYYRKREKK